ncbi:hypothetical protein TNCV_1012441 [Trichonephila clavipes]|uniref:Uncharacterized protein n=1 Tax=Trichonephila clavipes TaxID=2585209 RepID=A0A8X6VXK4_TRICX|nr:hypothetical protein TNCV_1012441 [Trichonephila clavipes]
MNIKVGVYLRKSSMETYGSDTLWGTQAFESLRRGKQKFHQYRSKWKVMLQMFFYIQDIVLLEFILEGRTSNKECVDILCRLRTSIRKKDQNFWLSSHG